MGEYFYLFEISHCSGQFGLLLLSEAQALVKVEQWQTFKPHILIDTAIAISAGIKPRYLQ
ncbi:MAG: hypothetical protein ACJA13_001199 [Paraglaciecola sp.]|jgi:hypothetical protein